MQRESAPRESESALEIFFKWRIFFFRFFFQKRRNFAKYLLLFLQNFYRKFYKLFFLNFTAIFSTHLLDYDGTKRIRSKKKSPLLHKGKYTTMHNKTRFQTHQSRKIFSWLNENFRFTAKINIIFIVTALLWLLVLVLASIAV